MLRFSQTRFGAGLLFDAGLFQAVQESGLFSVDPDIGIGMVASPPCSPWLIHTDIDNPEALQKYYELLLSVLRIVTSLVLSRGPQNEHTLEQARNFLTRNRQSMVSVLKRQAKIGGVLVADTSNSLDELVESYTILITMTGFLEVSSLNLTYGYFLN